MESIQGVAKISTLNEIKAIFWEEKFSHEIFATKKTPRKNVNFLVPF